MSSIVGSYKGVGVKSISNIAFNFGLLKMSKVFLNRLNFFVALATLLLGLLGLNFENGTY